MQASSPTTPTVGRVVIDLAPVEPVTVDVQSEISPWLTMRIRPHVRRPSEVRTARAARAGLWADPDFFGW